MPTTRQTPPSTPRPVLSARRRSATGSSAQPDDCPPLPRPLDPATAALIAHPRGVVWQVAGEAPRLLSLGECRAELALPHCPPLVCHRGLLTARLGTEAGDCLDLLDLFAFVRPAQFCVPTPRGLAQALGLAAPETHEEEANCLFRLARALLDELNARSRQEIPARRVDSKGLAWVLNRAGWPWGPVVLRALEAEQDQGAGSAALQVWRRLPEWNDESAAAPSGAAAVDPADARSRLEQLLGPQAEYRPAQADFASAAAMAFAAPAPPALPQVVLAEAGTGTGKTLGYIAPASLWAERNQAPVWISTYSRALQRQIDHELNRLFRDSAIKADKVVIRKGRENYLCLLSLEEAAGRLQARLSQPHSQTDAGAVATALIARWALATRDGDMVGGDLPGWLVSLLGPGRVMGLADRRGECIFSACPHYRCCFIERTIRRARTADIVVANHALVMVQAALGGLDDESLPSRYVFDESHHLFDAADSAFSVELSGQEAADLRRWFLGPDGSKSRARGLKMRCEDLVGADEQGAAALDAVLQAARALPAAEWRDRLYQGMPYGPCESFLAEVRRCVLERAADQSGPYSLECDPRPADDGVIEAAADLEAALRAIADPLRKLARALALRLEEEAAQMDGPTRQRIEALLRSLSRRALMTLDGWIDMLHSLPQPLPLEQVDWFSITRSDGQDTGCAFHRHWIDPTKPFADLVAAPADGLVLTSATLCDGRADTATAWEAASRRTGLIHLEHVTPVRVAMASPFDFPARTRVLLVTDVPRTDMLRVADAYRRLFLASGGGGLGLFTAVSRLRSVHRLIAGPLDDDGIPLLAQHVDGIDTPTLVDIFRATEDACLLGTDALRDGVDVPGRSLRLIVLERVPWPRPDILHVARRGAFGGRAYDDALIRLRLKQAFGRLMRRQGDGGVFVLLDDRLPSRLGSAFPPGVRVERMTLDQAVEQTGSFLHRLAVGTED